MEDLGLSNVFWFLTQGPCRYYIVLYTGTGGFTGGSVVKNPPANEGNVALIPGSGRLPAGGSGNPLQYSCLENPMDSGSWWATVHGVAKSQTRLSDWALHKAQTGIIFLFIYFHWRLITLQYCSGFCHTSTWISHGCTCVPHPEPSSHLPPHPIPQGCPSAPALSTLTNRYY